jgi:hypothetical protein
VSVDDFIARPASGTSEESSSLWDGGTPPPVLLGALGAALLIAITLVAFLIGSGSGGDTERGPLPAGATGVDDPAETGAPAGEGRVLLTLSIEGGGSGKVSLDPRSITCTETCERQFTVGSRVTLTADAVPGSRFEGWQDACTGSGQCSFTMDRERSVTATFEGSPSFTGQCGDNRDNDTDGFVDDADPGCRNDNTEAPNNRPTDCNDGRDNDGDGLVDSAQDPGCSGDGTEQDPGTDAPAPPPVTTTPPPATTTPVPPPPPPPPPASTTTTPAAPPATPAISECRDGRDNDGDGRTDRPGDPGCDSDGTEAGG